LISLLRLIDINDDGVIDEDEFNYFISVFKIIEPQEKLNIILNKRYGTKEERNSKMREQVKLSEISELRRHESTLKLRSLMKDSLGQSSIPREKFSSNHVTSSHSKKLS